MSYDYVKSSSDGGGSEPFLSSSSASNTTERRTAFIVGGVVTVYTLVAVILLLVYAFSQHTLVPNVAMICLLFLLYGNMILLYRWATSADVDDKFKYVLMYGVAILVVANTVAIMYATGVSGSSCPICTCPNCPCLCNYTQFYLNQTGYCYDLCLDTNSSLLNITLGDDFGVNCVGCYS
jgi:hypothetical protein